MEAILNSLDGYKSIIKEAKNQLLANLVELGEIPAPTFHEQRRVQRFAELTANSGCQNSAVDEVGNGTAILPGKQESSAKILVAAHADTRFSEKVDHNIRLRENSAVGPGIADNSMGLAVLASLPNLLERLNIELERDLVLLAASRSLDRGDLGGIRFFLQHNTLPLKAGICLEGAQLGRLSYSCIGLLRGEVRCRVPEQVDWTKFATSSAIVTLNEIIDEILQIRVPSRPRTQVVLPRVEGGSSFNRIAKEAVLQFEIRGESADVIESVASDIDTIISEVQCKSDSRVSKEIISRRQPCGLSFDHPLVANTRALLEALDVQPTILPSTSELSAIIGTGVPAVTMGLSTADNKDKTDETIYLDPLYSGVAQLIGILKAVDEGYCDED
ncbi:MAG: peptidase dimerization domain-containing protein [Planctomycetota bacterium]